MGPFVGRETELESLVGLDEAAARGDVAAAVITGDPGSGKSRLLDEASARSQLPNRFRVVGYEPERDVPLAAAAGFIRSLSAATPFGSRLGELVFASGGEALPLDPIRIFEAAHQAQRAVGPTLLVIDDLQWVDDLSLALFHYLVRAADESFAVLAAARSSENAASFAGSLEQVLPSDRIVRVELGPLASDEALELVKALAPTLDDEDARSLAARSSGSPFWLEVLVRSGENEPDVGRLVTARLRASGADAARLLGLLAVAARPVMLPDAADLIGWAEDRVRHAVRELVLRGIAVETGGAVALVHDLIRVAAARELPEEERIRLHQRIGRWLVESAGDDIGRLREALAHRHAGGLASVELASRVARAPQRTLLGDDGLSLLVAIADEADAFDEAALALNDDIARLASALGRHEVALERWLALADRRHDPHGHAQALLQASKAAFALDDIRRARAYIDAARENGVEDELLALELDIQRAALDLWSDAQTNAARASAHEIAKRAARIVDRDSRAQEPYLEAMRVEYEAAYQEDDPQAMLRAADLRATVAQSLDEEVHLNALLAGARAMRRIGRVHDAAERSGRVYAEARRRVLPRLELDAGYWLSAFLLQTGRVAEADEVVASTEELASRIADEARGRHSIARVASEVDYYHRDWRGGVNRLLAYAGGASQHARIELHQLAALWDSYAGGADVADQVVAQLAVARSCADAAGCPRCATELRLAAADALVHVGRRSEAATSIREWTRMQGRPQPRDTYVRNRVDAFLTDDIELLEDAAREAERLGFVLDALWTRVDHGSLLATSDRSRAKDVLAEVVARADERGAHTIAEVAGKRLRALGVRTWRRGAEAGTLTEREQAIARLIAEGASNPEIAQQLFLSRKTVERHVSNLLRKAGVRNRAELAARLPDLEVEGAHR